MIKKVQEQTGGRKFCSISSEADTIPFSCRPSIFRSHHYLVRMAVSLPPWSNSPTPHIAPQILWDRLPGDYIHVHRQNPPISHRPQVRPHLVSSSITSRPPTDPAYTQELLHTFQLPEGSGDQLGARIYRFCNNTWSIWTTEPHPPRSALMHVCDLTPQRVTTTTATQEQVVSFGGTRHGGEVMRLHVYANAKNHPGVYCQFWDPANGAGEEFWPPGGGP